MTSDGRRWAFLIGIVIAFALPKRVEQLHDRCTTYRTGPFGFYLIGQAFGRDDLGFAYTTGEDCR